LSLCDLDCWHGHGWRENLRGDFDALPVSGLVAVRVAAAAGKVFDFDAFDDHCKGPVFVVGHAACPFYCAVGVLGRVAAGPAADLEVHGSLRIVFAVESEGIVVVQGADDVAVNDPFKLLSSPDGGVVVDVLVIGDGVPDCTIVGGGVALACRMSAACSPQWHNSAYRRSWSPRMCCCHQSSPSLPRQDRQTQALYC